MNVSEPNNYLESVSLRRETVIDVLVIYRSQFYNPCINPHQLTILLSLDTCLLSIL